MSQFLTGSLCYTDIVQHAKAGHSAFSRGKNGKVYFNIAQWINDNPDQYGNISSIQLNSTQEKREIEGKVYIGNAKIAGSASSVQDDLSNKGNDEDLPF